MTQQQQPTLLRLAIAATALVAVVVGTAASADHSSVAGVSLAPVDRKLEDLDAEFATIEQRSRRQQQQVKDDKQALALALQVLDSEMVHYAVEKRTLLAARSLIERHFVAGSEPLDEFFAPSAKLADAILGRAVMRAIADALLGTESGSKKIYLLGKGHKAKPQIESILRDYFEGVVAKRERAAAAEDAMERALEEYAKSTGRDTKSTLVGIDELIDEAMDCPICMEENEPLEELSGMHSMFRGGDKDLAQLVRQFVDKKLLDDFRSAVLHSSKSTHAIDSDEIESIDSDELMDLEEEILTQVK